MQDDLIIGLAGHIDHGKTSLIKALNGFDGDETIQEKQRGITLDISFSNLTLPSDNDKKIDRNISFIDVPGHEKLVKNMIAGAFGIDTILLVVACDDGLMPQSLEHIQIADILGIKQAICVISKTDLCVEPHKISKLKNEIQLQFSKLQNTILYSIETFNIYDEISIKRLLKLLFSIPKPHKEKPIFFRYYIDGIFSIPGAGTIVRGSVLSGNINIGEKVYICDLDKEVSVKTIKNHNAFLQTATPSHRIAFNLKGINSSNLKRGFLLSQKGYIRGFDEFDVALYLLANTPNLHNLEVQFFIGSKICRAKILLLDTANYDKKNQETNINKEKIKVLATIKTDEKIFSVFGERFVLRNSEGTIAGGMVLNPITDPIKKQQKILYLSYLLKKDFQNAFLMCSAIHKKGFGLISSAQRFGLSHQEAKQIAHSLTKNCSEMFFDEKNLILYHLETFQTIKTIILATFIKNKNALLSASSLEYKIKWATQNFIQKALDFLESKGKIIKKDGLYSSKQNNIKDIDEFLQTAIFEAICGKNTDESLSPPAPYNIYDELDIDRKRGDHALKILVSSQKIVRLEHNLFISTNALNQILQKMRSIIKQQGFVDITTLKTEVMLSRKYLIAYLERLDCFEDIVNEEGKRRFKYLL